MPNELDYTFYKPENPLSEFVYCFSSLQNLSGITDGIIIPNGKIDLIFSKDTNHHFTVILMGLETTAKPMPDQDVSSFFSISFNPLAVEYIVQQPIADIVNNGRILPDNFWGFTLTDLNDFNRFCHKATAKIMSLIPSDIDPRKQKLFQLIESCNGEISVAKLADEVGWSERQINRYFNKQLGVPLKTYNSILRFQASLPHIKEGLLFPQLDFTDQSHFIKEIRKLSGVSPKELYKNHNDRFLQFLLYD